ncbi:hypothetical protein KKF82_05655 [Patescibacteria group bacterium]|nr:hypothetical protein [Patescibacteria group bacterium]
MKILRKILCFLESHKYEKRVVFRIKGHEIKERRCVYCNYCPAWNR